MVEVVENIKAKFVDLCIEANQRIRSTEVPNMIAKIAFLAVLYIIAIFWTPAFYIAIFASSILIFLEFDYKSIAYFLFFYVWANFAIGRGAVWSMAGVYMTVCIIKAIFFEPRSELKKLIWMGIAFVPILAYVFVGKFWVNSITVLFLCILLMLVVYANDKIGFKQMALYFVFGILISCCVGLFAQSFNLLGHRIPDHRVDGLIRFTGLTTNPNVLYGHILCGISVLLVLHLKGLLKFWQMSAMLVGLSVFGFMTFSRGFYLFFAVILSVYIGLLILKERANSLRIIALMFVIMLATCGILYKYTFPAIEWALRSFETERTRHQESFINVEVDNIIEQIDDTERFDPGRFGIWQMNIKLWLDNPKNFLFGTGLDSKNLGNMRQHNDLIFIFVKTGVVGAVSFAFFFGAMFYILYGAERRKFTLAPFLIIIAVICLGLIEPAFPKMRFFEYIFLYVLAVGASGLKAQNSTQKQLVAPEQILE